MLHHLRLLIICLLSLVPLAIHAEHVSGNSHADHSAGHLQLPLTQESAAELIRSETGDKVLSVDSEKVENETFFRVKVISKQGRVKVYRVASSTGEIVD